MEKENLTVAGDKITTIDKKVGEKGYFEDKFGNKIYPTATYKKESSVEEVE